MANILLRVPIEAEPDGIFEALATSEGVTGWWSSRTEGPFGPDSTMKVAFPDASMTFDFEVTEQNPVQRVAWHCLAFEIQQGEDGNTSVLFTHGGWATTEESFPFVAYSWAQILPRLKGLAESGDAQPFFDF